MGEMWEAIEKYKEALATLSKTNPHAVDSFIKFMSATMSKGALESKTKYLIALGTAITSRCKYSIAIYVQRCLAEGASREEIIEAAEVAVLTGGEPALTYVDEVLKALDEFTFKRSI